MGDAERLSLASFVRYLPRLQRLQLGDDELRSIPVHAEPPTDQNFLSLGELPPGAPSIETGGFPFVGTRQLYAYHSDVPPELWQRLATGIQLPRASGTGGTGMFGNDEEKACDVDDPSHSWSILNAGEPYHPP